MKAIVFTGLEHIEVKDIPIPRVREGWTLIKVCYAGICGSDMTIFHGKHPRAKAPLVLGHEFSGYVASPHPKYSEGTLVSIYPFLSCGACSACQEGFSNACHTSRVVGIDKDGGMAEYALVPENSLFPVPEGVSPQVGAYIEPIGISVHAARRGKYLPGDSVVVYGAGGIGMATAIALRKFGADNIVICEPDAGRLKLAKSFGFHTIHSDEHTLDQVLEFTRGNGADYVFDCAGHQSVIDILPDSVKVGGQVVMVAGYKTPPAMNFQKGMFREFNIQFVRNSTRKDFGIACQMAAQPLGYEKLLNCILPIDQAEKGFSSPAGAIKVMFEIQ
ncbi:alcohol dehydrogenase catalytic domain-containing protein [Clostridium sp. KNHs216]|uniref:zinc-dependent alcohol dehydrogenase n=1 Tax=Clostridium sp. KNHs216 TaxID=1550235 RepID=UPI00114D7F2B|nr:alcohol dehydrogenase catalytic domain-containing protein [Clostridium sp. KNHs216]TQI68322.1 2-desacetyl-2-hydroxyethyl bacteriochlorophyllide A dehydrogenase [Clostridium sp. KNHs216]